MQTYRVFIASSIVEFSALRSRIVYFFTQLSGALDACEIEPFICEQASKSIVLGRKQAEFNERIVQSDLFLLLVGSRMGCYTLEELDTAIACSREQGSPAIVIVCDSDELRASLRERTRGCSVRVLDTSVRDPNALLGALLGLLAEELGFRVERSARRGLCVGGRRILAGA